jgi:hypothetical protein
MEGGLLPRSATCLTLILFLGLGAAVAPQLLRAEDAGIYDFIRQNAAMQAGAQRSFQSPVDGPRREYSGRSRTVSRLRATPPRSNAATPTLVACGSCEEARHYATPTDALLHDRTLRPGDTVMLNIGAVVFRGAERIPYTLDDFVDIKAATMLTTAERRQIDDVLGVWRKAKKVAVSTSIGAVATARAQRSGRVD